MATMLLLHCTVLSYLIGTRTPRNARAGGWLPVSLFVRRDMCPGETELPTDDGGRHEGCNFRARNPPAAIGRGGRGDQKGGAGIHLGGTRHPREWVEPPELQRRKQGQVASVGLKPPRARPLSLSSPPPPPPPAPPLPCHGAPRQPRACLLPPRQVMVSVPVSSFHPPTWHGIWPSGEENQRWEKGGKTLIEKSIRTCNPSLPAVAQTETGPFWPRRSLLSLVSTLASDSQTASD